MLRPVFPEARRLLEYQEGYGIDLENTGRLRIQCKSNSEFCSINMIEEVPKTPGTIRVLAVKARRKSPLLFIEIDQDFEPKKTPFHFVVILEQETDHSFVRRCSRILEAQKPESIFNVGKFADRTFLIVRVKDAKHLKETNLCD
jgi:hypothetical protein